jgi:AhpD family alkylhydroperoxidase
MTIETEAPPKQRIRFNRLLPEAYDALSALDEAGAAGLDRRLVDLVSLRSAQINGCAFCLDMHSKDALHHGDSSERLFMLPAWRESPGYTARERAALALTEAVTLVSETHVPDEVWADAAAEFEEGELASLLAVIISANAWNRMSIATRLPAGKYKPQ